jgi:hypothetical protein
VGALTQLPGTVGVTVGSVAVVVVPSKTAFLFSRRELSALV